MAEAKLAATKMSTTMKNLLVSLLICAFSVCADAQHKLGMLNKNGVWYTPTTSEVIDKVMSGDSKGELSGVSILRGTLLELPVSDLDAFADELGRIIVEGTRRQALLASSILYRSVRNDGKQDNPYFRSRDVLRRAYDGVRNKSYRKSRSVLRALVLAGDEDYVHDVFAASKKPEQSCSNTAQAKNPDCPLNENEWCVAGDVLIGFALRFPEALTKPAPDPDEVLPHCFGSVKQDGEWFHIVY